MANPALARIPIRAFQWDLARQIERLDFLKKLLPRYAEWGYQELYLHLEDAVHYPSLPGVGRTDAYTYQELGELILLAAQLGIRVVPIVNLLGHTQYLIKQPELRDLNELRDEKGRPLEHGQICPLHPRMMEVAEKLLGDIAPYCTAGKVHVGLDESFFLGKCPRCREEVNRIGLDGHFARYVQRLHTVCSRLGLQMGIWADMLYFIPGAIPQLPRGITAYDWYYYSFTKKPRVEFFNFAEHDLAPALKKQGISYYGCPMNGAFRHEPLPVFGDRLGNIRSWWQRCTTIEAEGILITSWEANRLALETTTTLDAAAASLWLEPSIEDNTTMLARGLNRVYELKYSQSIARSLMAADEFAFAGYARWQINDRWDVCAGTESTKPYRAEERFFARLSSGSRSWPKAFAASIDFRLYLAHRDVFVREMAREIFRLRRLFSSGKLTEVSRLLAKLKSNLGQFNLRLQTGRHASQIMWKRTREPGASSPNARMLEADKHRAMTLQRWLIGAIRQPACVLTASPVCGVWQLQFMVHNFAPAAQKIVVEERQTGNEWRELASRFTIEFRSNSAREVSKTKREFTAPVSSRDAALRILVSGVGVVAVSHLTLTNGVEVRRASDFRQKIILGDPAPKKGLPQVGGKSIPLLVNFP